MPERLTTRVWKRGQRTYRFIICRSRVTSGDSLSSPMMAAVFSPRDKFALGPKNACPRPRSCTGPVGNTHARLRGFKTSTASRGRYTAPAVILFEDFSPVHIIDFYFFTSEDPAAKLVAVLSISLSRWCLISTAGVIASLSRIY